MAKPAYLNPAEIREMAKKAALGTTTPERGKAATLLFATGVKGFEFAAIELRDLLFESGNWRPAVKVRSEIVFNDEAREIPMRAAPDYWKRSTPC